MTTKEKRCFLESSNGIFGFKTIKEDIETLKERQ
jgi:hypothetical protein